MAATIVRKTADESVTSSTTLQDDDHLLLAIDASATWIFRFMIFYQAGAAEDIKFAITVPSGATIIAGVMNDGNNDVFTTSGGEDAVAGDGGNETVILSGTVVNSTTAGDLQFQFAQNNSGGTASIVRANSYLIAWQP